MGVIVVVGRGGRCAFRGDPAWRWPRGLVLPVLGAVPERAARVAQCWSRQSSVEPSRSQKTTLVGVTSHLVAGQGRRLSWEKIPEATGLRVGWERGMNGRSRRP